MGKFTLVSILMAAAAFGQVPSVITGQLSGPAVGGAALQASIVITVTKADGSVHTSKIAGIPAAAGLEVLDKWFPTQLTPDGTPRYANAADLVKQNLIDVMQRLVESGYTSSQTEAEIKAIEVKLAEIRAKRAALFDAARKQ